MVIINFKLILLTLVAAHAFIDIKAENESSTPFSMATRVRPDSNFRPRYKGKIIIRHKLNLTDLAKKVNIQPDYYETGEGPEDDISDENSSIENNEDIMTTASTTPKPAGFHMSNYIKPGSSFKPAYDGRIIHRYNLNLTDLAKKVTIQPDYYEPGEGPEDDVYDEDLVDDNDDLIIHSGTSLNENKTLKIVSTTTSRSELAEKPMKKMDEDSDGESLEGDKEDKMFTLTTTTTVAPARTTVLDETTKFIFSKHVNVDSNFKPKYDGKIIHRDSINLTDQAKKVEIEPDYYQPGEGPEDDDDVNTKPSEMLTVETTSTKPMTISTTTMQTSTKKTLMFSKFIKPGSDFKPKYDGKIIHRDQLNLTELAKKVEIEPDYYNAGEGPDDDEDDIDLKMIDDNKQTIESSTLSTPATTTTTVPTTTTTVASSEPKKKVLLFSKLITPGKHFKPKYDGKIIHRDQLNLTELAKKVEIEPDYYDAGEGPDDVDDEADLKAIGDSTIGDNKQTIESSTLSTPATTTTTVPTTTTTVASSEPKKKVLLFSKLITPGPHFKPKYDGKIIHRDQLNLTELAKKVEIEPDYYEDGEGPDDVDDEADQKAISNQQSIESSTASTPVTIITTASSEPKKKVFLFSKFITPSPDFKPKYDGKIIHRDQLNLTELAKKVEIEPDYYEDGEGPDGDELNEDISEDSIESISSSSSTTTSTSTTATVESQGGGGSQSMIYDEELSDVDMAVGGISGIIEKILHGPKKSEITNHSKPEEVYSYLQNIVNEETGKAMKATMPRIYDYQYPIGNVVSQRCFNSFARFGDQFRRGFPWPTQMVASSAGFSINEHSLRNYGDFDRCINVVADDGERKYNEEIFTGQYCMMKVLLPLPPLNKNLTYWDKVLNFDNEDISGAFTTFLSTHSSFLYSNPLSMGVCIPSTCSSSEIEEVIHLFMKKFHIQVKFGLDCYTKLNLTVEALPGEIYDLNITQMIIESEKFSFKAQFKRLNLPQTWAILYIGVAILLVTLATSYELLKIKSNDSNNWLSTERNRPKSFFICFSACHNLQELFNWKDRYTYETLIMNSDIQGNDMEMMKNSPKTFLSLINTNSIDGLKSFALIWICLANFFFLGYQPQLLPSVAHIRDVLEDLKDSTLSQLFINSWLSMEIFFMISGFLLAYTALPYISKHDGRPNLLFFVVKRMIRFLPSLVFILLFLNLLPLWRNAGPLYNSGVEQILAPCKRFYWRNIFFTSNLYNYNETCLPPFWYITMEMQLSLIGIFVTVFAFNRSNHALKAFLIFILMGIIVPTYLALHKKLPISSILLNNAILEEIPNILREIHFNPFVHFAPYFIGLAIGYYARMSSKFQFKLPNSLRFVLWILLPLLTIMTMYIPFFWPFKANFKYDNGMKAIYFGSYRLLFISTFAWILYETIYNRAILMRTLLSFRSFRILSHLSYQIFLINLIVIWIYLFTRRHVLQDSFFENLCIASTLFMLSVMLSLITYLLFEAPMRSLYRYYFESSRILSLMSPSIQVNEYNDDKSPGRINYKKNYNITPNFLFTPHYNMITNINSRAESESGSISNYSISNSKDTFKSNGENWQVPKNNSIVTITPCSSDNIEDINNNNTTSNINEHQSHVC